MMFDKIPRRLHQQRAERLEARNPQAITPGQVVPPAQPVPAPDGNAKHPVQPVPAPVPAPAPAPAPVPAPAPAPPIPPPAALPSPPPPPPGAGPVPITTLGPKPATPSLPPTIVTTPTLPVIPSVTSIPTDTLSSLDVTTVVTTPTFRSLPPAESASASPSASATPSSSSMKSGTVVGAVVGGIAAVAIIGVLGFWILKRYLSSKDENDVGEGAWMRSSVAIPDDTPSSIVPRGPGSFGPSESPRPPTMIERRQMHNYNNMPPQFAQGGMEYPIHPYGVPDFGPGYPVSVPSSVRGYPSPIGPATPTSPSLDETMPPMQHASGIYFTRHDSNMSSAIADSVVLADMPNPHGTPADGYAPLDRTSVTAYQAQQYEEISRQLTTQQPMEAISEVEGDPVLGHVQPSGQEAFAHGTPPSVSPFADPAAPAPYDHADSTPPTLPPMRTMSPVDPASVNKSFMQIANEFPATPSSPVTRAFSPAVASSPRSASFPTTSSPPPLSPIMGVQRGQVVMVPPEAHAGRETPVQIGFNQQPASPPPSYPVAQVPPAVAGKARSVRGATYNDEDAYGGI